jgi:hypothetical protein
MEWTGHLSIVTAIFESAKDVTTKSMRTRLLLYNQLGPGMSDRSVQLPRSLHLMCPVGVETSCQAFPAVAEDITVDDPVEVAAPAEAGNAFDVFRVHQILAFGVPSHVDFVAMQATEFFPQGVSPSSYGP